MDTAEKREKTAAYMREYYLSHSTRPRRVPGAERERKVCRKCGKDKHRGEFTVRQSGPRVGHLSGHCKACNTEAASDAYRDKHAMDSSVYRRVEWPSKLKRLYGITPDDYYRMLSDQGGACGLCGTTDPNTGNRQYKRTVRDVFDVDHCHVTGRVRGLLCTRCNRLVGLAKDSLETATRLVNYLKKEGYPCE